MFSDLCHENRRHRQPLGGREASDQRNACLIAVPAREKSILPVCRAFSVAITLPMSRTDQAPVSSIAAATAFSTSFSDICRGMYSRMMTISCRSWSARSSRPPSS